MESQKGLVEQSLPLTGEGMRRGDCMCNLTEKTHIVLEKKLKNFLLVVANIFEYIGIILIFGKGRWLSYAPAL
jgi:hypothetical protein